MDNTATIEVIETEDGIAVQVSAENRTSSNKALVAAINMVGAFKQQCEATQH